MGTMHKEREEGQMAVVAGEDPWQHCPCHLQQHCWSSRILGGVCKTHALGTSRDLPCPEGFPQVLRGGVTPGWCDTRTATTQIALRGSSVLVGW